jgi:hypothetical protein
LTPPKTFLEDSKSKSMKGKVFRIGVNLYIAFKVPFFVKVKAYKRVRNGKVEKVRSHYRSVVGRKRFCS